MIDFYLVLFILLLFLYVDKLIRDSSRFAGETERNLNRNLDRGCEELKNRYSDLE